MKRFAALFILLTVGLIAQPSVPFAQQQPQEIPFDSVPDFLKMPPGTYFGEVAGVAVNSKGDVFVYDRNVSAGGDIKGPQGARLFQFSPNGAFVRDVRGLHSMAWARSVRVDKDDNVWLVDSGSDMVVKLSPDLSRVLLVLGRRRESPSVTRLPAPRDPQPRPVRDGTFNEPTDVAWDLEGNIFVTDGDQVPQSVAKFDKYGAWVKRVGKGNMAERGDGPGEFDHPSNIVVDAKGSIYVGDRANRRIQVLDSDLRYVREFRIDVPVPPDATSTYLPGAGIPLLAPGAPSALCITPGPNQVLYAADFYPGRIYKLSLDGRVLGYLGKNGKQLKQFNWIKAIACPSENEIYVGELLSWRVQKLILRPAKTSSDP